MATQNKIIEMIGAIKTIYSYYAKDTNVQLLVGTWTRLLDSYDDQVVDAAFYKCLQTCKMPPTPADVIEQIQSMYRSLEPSDEELWTDYKKALRDTCEQMARFNYTYVDSSGISQGDQARQKVEEIFNGLNDKIKGYLGTKGELMRNARSWGEDENAFFTFEKPRFMKQMPIMEKRKEYSGFMLEGGNHKFLLKGD